MDSPSKLGVIRKPVSLSRARPTLSLRCEENVTRWKWNWSLMVCVCWTSEDEKKRSVSRWTCKNKSHTNSPCNLPDVLVIVDINARTVCGNFVFVLKLTNKNKVHFNWETCYTDSEFKENSFPHHCLWSQLFLALRSVWREEQEQKRMWGCKGIRTVRRSWIRMCGYHMNEWRLVYKDSCFDHEQLWYLLQSEWKYISTSNVRNQKQWFWRWILVFLMGVRWGTKFICTIKNTCPETDGTWRLAGSLSVHSLLHQTVDDRRIFPSKGEIRDFMKKWRPSCESLLCPHSDEGRKTLRCSWLSSTVSTVSSKNEHTHLNRSRNPVDPVVVYKRGWRCQRTTSSVFSTQLRTHRVCVS